MNSAESYRGAVAAKACLEPDDREVDALVALMEQVQADAIEACAREAINATHAGPTLEPMLWSVALSTANSIAAALRALKPKAGT